MPRCSSRSARPGTGDGSTTFNLPDLRGRVPVGLGTHADVNAVAKSDGIATVSNRRPAHKHTVVQPAISTPAVNRTGNVALNDPGHNHSTYTDDGPGNPSMALATGLSYHAPQDYGIIAPRTTGITVSAQPTFALANAPVASGGTVGPQTGAEPTDSQAYLVVNFAIKT